MGFEYVIEIGQCRFCNRKAKFVHIEQRFFTFHWCLWCEYHKNIYNKEQNLPGTWTHNIKDKELLYKEDK